MDLSDISIGELNSEDIEDLPNLLYREYAVTPTPSPSRITRTPSRGSPSPVPSISPIKHIARYSVGEETKHNSRYSIGQET